MTKDKKLRGAQRGSAIHRFMQIADFSAFAAAQDRRAELEKQANAAAQSLRMTREQADAVMDGAEEALRFLDSETGGRSFPAAACCAKSPLRFGWMRTGRCGWCRA